MAAANGIGIRDAPSRKLDFCTCRLQNWGRFTFDNWRTNRDFRTLLTRNCRFVATILLSVIMTESLADKARRTFWNKNWSEIVSDCSVRVPRCQNLQTTA